jgi:hypothetical protein
MHQQLKDLHQLHLRVINVCDYAKSEKNVKGNPQLACVRALVVFFPLTRIVFPMGVRANKQRTPGVREQVLGFNRTTVVKEVLRRVLKLFPIKDRFSAALFVPASQEWMPLSASLDELHLKDNVRFSQRPSSLCCLLCLPRVLTPTNRDHDPISSL